MSLVEFHAEVVQLREDLTDILAQLQQQVEAYLTEFKKYNYMREVNRRKK